MVGHAVIGVRRSSMNASSLSSQPRRSGFSSMSYNLHRLSDFFDEATEETAVVAAAVAPPPPLAGEAGGCGPPMPAGPRAPACASGGP